MRDFISASLSWVILFAATSPARPLELDLDLKSGTDLVDVYQGYVGSIARDDRYQFHLLQLLMASRTGVRLTLKFLAQFFFGEGFPGEYSM